MSSPRPRIWLLPLLFVGAVVVLLPTAALTESAIEADVKDALGLLDRCVPDTVESPGWRAEPGLPDDRDEPRAVAVGGAIYIAGGQSELLDYGDPSPVPGVDERVKVRLIDNLTRFEPTTGEYTELSPMPVPVNHQSMVAYRGDVYSVGGHGSFLNGAAPKRAFQRYSPKTDRWTPMPPMPTARGAAGAAVIGHRLVVVGGMGRHGRILPTLEEFDFRTGKWSSGPDMPTPREHLGVAVVDGKLYAIGGRDESSDALSVVEGYDPRTRRWEELAPLPEPTGGLAAVAAGGAVYAIGGGNDRQGAVSGAVQRFDPRRGEWEELARMRTPRHGFAAAALGGRLYVFAGSPCAQFAASDLAESFELPATESTR